MSIRVHIHFQFVLCVHMSNDRSTTMQSIKCIGCGFIASLREWHISTRSRNNNDSVLGFMRNGIELRANKPEFMAWKKLKFFCMLKQIHTRRAETHTHAHTNYILCDHLLVSHSLNVIAFK